MEKPDSFVAMESADSFDPTGGVVGFGLIGME